MIFFILTNEGYKNIVSILGHVPSPIWFNDGVLAESEIEVLRSKGIELTNFVVPINPLDKEAITSAIETIQEHHSGESVWVEFPPYP